MICLRKRKVFRCEQSVFKGLVPSTRLLRKPETWSIAAKSVEVGASGDTGLQLWKQSA
jgi:hypothetical protein